MKADKKLEYIKMLDIFSEAFGENEAQSPEEIREELRSEGLDIDNVEADLFQFQQEISMKARRLILDEAKSKRDSYLMRMQEIVERVNNWTREQLFERFNNISRGENDLVIAYRDLEDKKDEDIKTILIDIELSMLIPEDGEDEYQ